jgi:hypothetical protein
MNLRTLAILAAMIAVPAAAAAQDHACRCCANKHGAEPEGFFTGIVYAVSRHVGMDVQLTVGGGETTLEVLVAPMEWLDRKSIVFRTGERVEILGARQDCAPNTIVAREIWIAGQSAMLRDREGRALWD